MSQRMWAQHQRWQEAGWLRTPSDRWMWNPAQWLCQPLLLKSPSLRCSSHVPEAYQLWHTPNSFVFLILPTITSRGASFPWQMVQLSGDLMKSSALIAVKSRACVWTEPTRLFVGVESIFSSDAKWKSQLWTPYTFGITDFPSKAGLVAVPGSSRNVTTLSHRHSNKE